MARPAGASSSCCGAFSSCRRSTTSSSRSSSAVAACCRSCWYCLAYWVASPRSVSSACFSGRCCSPSATRFSSNGPRIARRSRLSRTIRTRTWAVHRGVRANELRRWTLPKRSVTRGSEIAREVGAIGRERLYHLREHLRRRRDDLSAVKIVAFAGEIADQAAGLEHEQASGGDVPRVQADFPEAVVEARGDIRQIERGRARATQSRALHDHRLHHREIRIEIATVAKRETGADQRIAQMRAARNADAPIVQERAAAARRGKEIIANRIVDHRLRDHVAMRKGDRHAILRKAVQEVRRAVER